MENLLNATQAAEVYGVSKMTMAEWCARGYVPGAQKVGKSWIIPESSLPLIERPDMGRPPKEGGNGKQTDDV
ncbi:MAG: helix-turn-helix domain-containing protein [Ardenticatenaceae bacterium]|nr:helix-turn-helix domain-containing protein [Ardenticatenaceae bacterium]